MHLKRNYGITLSQYAEIYRIQGGKCALCARDIHDRAPLDHNHKTGAVRGILCRTCNIDIGRFDDDPDRLRAAAAYLERHSA